MNKFRHHRNLSYLRKYRYTAAEVYEAVMYQPGFRWNGGAAVRRAFRARAGNFSKTYLTDAKNRRLPEYDFDYTVLIDFKWGTKTAEDIKAEFNNPTIRFVTRYDYLLFPGLDLDFICPLCGSRLHPFHADGSRDYMELIQARYLGRVSGDNEYTDELRCHHCMENYSILFANYRTCDLCGQCLPNVQEYSGGNDVFSYPSHICETCYRIFQKIQRVFYDCRNIMGRTNQARSTLNARRG